MFKLKRIFGTEIDKQKEVFKTYTKDCIQKIIKAKT